MNPEDLLAVVTLLGRMQRTIMALETRVRELEQLRVKDADE